jgi:predicted transposase YbfD/YdcC
MARREKKVEEPTPESILEYFASLKDPRVERTKQHSLLSILILCLCAVTCGADSFVAIERYGRSKEAWLREHFDFANGIPSHDTIGRVLALLEPKALAEMFARWTTAVAEHTRGDLVAIDGKTLRRSFRHGASKTFVHMVSAWSSRNKLVLAQAKTDDKSNEIKAIPELLQLLALKGCTVTIDAAGCQRDIAKQIVEKGGNYLLAVKENQPTLHAALVELFDAALHGGPHAAELDAHETQDSAHGRKETRRCWTLPCPETIDVTADWSNLSTCVLIESERQVGDAAPTEEIRLFISSDKKLTAKAALSAVRSHWGIENQLHWVLDVAFCEDDCRVQASNAAANFAVLRHISLNLLKQATKAKAGIKTRRLMCGWNDDFLLDVLTARAAGI